MRAADDTLDGERNRLLFMLDRLNRFGSDQLPIGPVVRDLEGLLGELRLADEPWRDDFIEAWSALEVPFAVALDRNSRLPTAQDEDVTEGVSRLQALVESKLTELAL